MLAAGAPAAEVMTEYVRACRRLGHSVPEPAHLHAAYTAEEGLDLQALDDDHRTLSEALAAVEEALVLQEQARRALVAAWRGAGAVAAADHLGRHTETAATVVDGLHGSVTALGELRNRLWQLIDAKVDSTQGIEARGTRAEWLSAARTVTTGAGDRAGASEMVDMQVAPFVANDIALDWVSAMRDTESAIRQAYRDAAAVIAAQASVVFERAGLSGAIPVAAETVSAPVARGSVVPAGFVAGPAPADAAPAQMPVGPGVAPAVLPVAATAAPPTPPLPPPTTPVGADPLAAAAAPIPAAAAPLGSGLSGLSGLGQSFADMLGGLLGSGGGLGESLGAADDLNPALDDDPGHAERDELTDQEADEDEEDRDGEEPDEDEPLEGDTPAEKSAGPAEAGAPTEPVAPVAVPPEPVVPTPVPEPLADPAVAAPAEPVPADTPCEIAADELPQAGP